MGGAAGPIVSPAIGIDAPFQEVARWLSKCGALLPAVAAMEPAVLIQRLEDPTLPRVFGPHDLLFCPYCKAEKKKGTLQEVLRTRLPGGAGSDIAAWAAEYAGAGGFHLKEGEASVLWEEEAVVGSDKRGRAAGQLEPTAGDEGDGVCVACQAPVE